MGFVNLGNKVEKTNLQGVSLDFLHRNGCAVCPLNHSAADLKHPHMAPHGAKQPLVYILGEAPGAEEDAKGVPFVGKAGRTLRTQIPTAYENLVRFSNAVRTRPPKNRTPEPLEIECCRPSVV